MWFYSPIRNIAVISCGAKYVTKTLNLKWSNHHGIKFCSLVDFLLTYSLGICGSLLSALCKIILVSANFYYSKRLSFYKRVLNATAHLVIILETTFNATRNAKDQRKSAQKLSELFVVKQSLTMGSRYASRFSGPPYCKCYCIVFVFCQLALTVNRNVIVST